MMRNRIPRIIKTFDEQLEPAIRATANAIQASAQERVPEASGDLKDSIEVQKVSDQEYRVVVGEWYGMFVEHGTTKMPARPFLIPAAEAEKRRIPELARTALRDL